MTTLKGLCVLWVLLVCSFAQVTSSDLEVSASDNKPVLGTSVLLSCRIFKPNGYPVEWKLANPQVGTKTIAATHMMRNCSNNGWLISDRTYYRWETCEKSVTDGPPQYFNITIIKTRLRDTGHWYCDEMNAPSRRSVYIEVAVPPGPPMVSGYGSVAKGVKHTLTCNATHDGLTAPITYKWFKDGRSGLYHEGPILTFPQTTLANSGTYTCNATNTYGSTKKSGRLDVTDQVVSVTLSVSSSSPIEGKKVSLTCVAVGGNPAPVLTISSSGNQWVNKSVQTRRLSVEAVVKRDDKELTCSAKVAGVTTVVTDKVSLDVKYPPDVVISTNPPNRVVTENVGYASLRCEAQGGNPNKPTNGTIAWYYKGKEIVNRTNSEWTYSISRPNRQQAGYYKCRVSNYRGIFAWNSIQLHIIYPAEWDNAFPDHRRATAGIAKMATFTLHILAKPKPSKVAWLRETPGMGYDPTRPTPSLGYFYQDQAVDERTYALNFWRVSSSDYGKYRVYVTNDAGTKYFVFTLLPPGPPYPPCCLKVTSSTSVSMTLTFKPNYARDSSQFFEISYRKLNSKSGSWAKFPGNISDAGSSAIISQKVSDLMPKTVYEFRVRAYTHLGKSGYSGTVLATTRASPFPSPKVTVKKEGKVAVISWDYVRKGTHIEVVSCSAKGLCKTYVGTNLTKLGIPVEEAREEDVYAQTFFVRYYDGNDLAVTSKSVHMQKVPAPPTPYDFPSYGYGLVGFAGGCVLVAIIAVIIWRVRVSRQAKGLTGNEFDDDFDSEYNYSTDGQENQIHTIAGATGGSIYANGQAFDLDVQNGNATKMAYQPPDEIYENLNPEEQKARLKRLAAAKRRSKGKNAYETPTGVRPSEIPVATYQSLHGNRNGWQAPRANGNVHLNHDSETARYVSRP